MIATAPSVVGEGRDGHSETGAATTELALITPALIAFLLLVALGGRLVLAGGDVEGASRDAARAASIERDDGAAEPAAAAAAAATLAGRGVTCRRLDVSADTSDFRAGGSVTVDVSCEVSLTSLSLLRVPGSRTEKASATETIDVFRGVE